ncbi:unnamed protein product, partial [Iphiclides podalirius]
MAPLPAHRPWKWALPLPRYTIPLPPLIGSGSGPHRSRHTLWLPFPLIGHGSGSYRSLHTLYPFLPSSASEVGTTGLSMHYKTFLISPLRSWAPKVSIHFLES